MDTEFERLHWKASALGTRLSEIEFDLLTCTSNKHQACDALLRLKTTGTDRSPIDDDIPVLGITPSNLPEKEEARAGSMHGNGVIDHKEGVQLPAVYAIAALTAPGHNVRQITVNNFVNEQEKFVLSTSVIYCWLTGIRLQL